MSTIPLADCFTLCNSFAPTLTEYFSFSWFCTLLTTAPATSASFAYVTASSGSDLEGSIR